MHTCKDASRITGDSNIAKLLNASPVLAVEDEIEGDHLNEYQKLSAPKRETLTCIYWGSLLHSGRVSAIETLRFGTALLFLADKGLVVIEMKTIEDGSFTRNDRNAKSLQAMVLLEGQKHKIKTREAAKWK
ncbi:hypothetical protein CR513_34460, partial [Mucuna pruriens]